MTTKSKLLVKEMIRKDNVFKVSKDSKVALHLLSLIKITKRISSVTQTALYVICSFVVAITYTNFSSFKS